MGQKYSVHGWGSKWARRNMREASRPSSHKLTFCKNDNYLFQLFYIYCPCISGLLSAAPAPPEYLALVCFLRLYRFLGLDLCGRVGGGNFHQFPSRATVTNKC